jgi:hypothetical protein
VTYAELVSVPGTIAVTARLRVQLVLVASSGMDTLTAVDPAVAPKTSAKPPEQFVVSAGVGATDIPIIGLSRNVKNESGFEPAEILNVNVETPLIPIVDGEND